MVNRLKDMGVKGVFCNIRNHWLNANPYSLSRWCFCDYLKLQSRSREKISK